jgi:hypothetical protein
MGSEPRWEAIIRAYEQRHRGRGRAELKSFADEPTLDAAVSRAGLALRADGKRYGHQRRIPGYVLEAARKRLLAAPLAQCASFHELFVAVQGAIAGIPGIGELMVYDTALRIGAWLHLEPDRVYLHSGTRQGARRLGLNHHAEAIERHELPQGLRSLPPEEVEDILCIFKDWFTGSEPPNDQMQQTRSAPARSRGPRC